MNNGFGINEIEYERIKTDSSYFRGRVVEKLNSIENELRQQSKVDEKIKNELKELPCNKNGEKIKYALLLIVVLFILLGYNNFPIITKFFGF